MKYLKLIPKDMLYSLRFFIPPFLALLLGKILFELLAFNFYDLNQYLLKDSSMTHEISTEVKFNEIKARLLWVTSVTVYLFIIGGYSAFLWNTVRRSLTKKTLLILLLIVATTTTVETIYFLQADFSKSPMASIFSFTFNALSGSRLYTASELYVVHTTLDFINFITFIIPPFVMVTGCCILHEKPMNTHSGPEYFLGKSGRLKKLVTGASAMMVIGIIHMQLWLNWPLTLIEEPKLTTQLESITLVICQYWGVTYTLTIAALYLPAASYLCDQAKIAIETGNDEEIKKDPSNWLIKNKMLLSPLAQFPQLIAVIAPMLVGSFGSTLSGLVTF